VADRTSGKWLRQGGYTITTSIGAATFPGTIPGSINVKASTSSKTQAEMSARWRVKMCNAGIFKRAFWTLVSLRGHEREKAQGYVDRQGDEDGLVAEFDQGPANVDAASVRGRCERTGGRGHKRAREEADHEGGAY
jgi:hypothetical protein